jgi:hypothetical protein
MHWHTQGLLNACGSYNRQWWTIAGPGPFLPKPQALYQALETGVRPKRINMLTACDDAYWKSVRQAAAPCFSMRNMKQVGMAAMRFL